MSEQTGVAERGRASTVGNGDRTGQELGRIVRSQVIYERVVEGRREDFRYALRTGIELSQLATAAGLTPAQVEAIVR